MSEPLIVARPPAPHLRGLILRVTGYAEIGMGMQVSEPASLIFPVIFSFGSDWRIRLGAEAKSRTVPSFAAGLLPGPVMIGSDGAAACVQVDLTPKGAVRLFGGLAVDLAGDMVDLDLLPGFGLAAQALIQRLAETPNWPARLDLAEAFVAARLTHGNAREIETAWHCLARGLSVAETAAEIGWSTRHLASRFRRETGLRPVTALRMLRFRRAVGLAQQSRAASWAMIAAEAGYADQAHMIRDFRSLAGTSPTTWARRASGPVALLRD